MFIVTEGLDGAGKSTQVALIREAFEEMGMMVEYIHFPRFDAPVYGDLVAKFLRGELGKLEDVNPYLVALIYAGDRQEASKQIREWLADENTVVIADRYVYSNIGYQCAKIDDPKEQSRLREWILHLEYEYNGIPRPDLTLFLDVPFSFTKKKLTEQREGNDRDYLNGKQDIHEASLDLQERVRQVYLGCAREDENFRVIDCVNEADGNMLPPEKIFNKIKDEISRRV